MLDELEEEIEFVVVDETAIKIVIISNDFPSQTVDAHVEEWLKEHPNNRLRVYKKLFQDMAIIPARLNNMYATLKAYGEDAPSPKGRIGAKAKGQKPQDLQDEVVGELDG